MDLETNNVALIISIFLVSTGTGFLTAGELIGEEDQNYDTHVNHTVSPEKEILNVKFDNRSLELRWEDVPEANVFIDLNQDGKFDRELNITSDSQIRTTEEILSMEEKSYRLYFRYYDEQVKNSGYLTLYRIEQII